MGKTKKTVKRLSKITLLESGHIIACSSLRSNAVCLLSMHLRVNQMKRRAKITEK